MINFSLQSYKLPNNFGKIHQVLKEKGILGEYSPRFNFPDEPQFYNYLCERKSTLSYVKKGYGYGSGEKKENAIIASIAEAIEHYSLLNEKVNDLIIDSYKNLGSKAVNPYLFNPFSKTQLKDPYFSNFIFDENTKFSWIKTHHLNEKKDLLIPSQLIYANYVETIRNEPVIRIPISTGAACGPNYYFAIYRGLCEAIERDNYMISYLNRLKMNVIDLDTDLHLREFKKRIERYDLNLYCLETTLDFEINSFLAVIIDSTGIGPAVSVGMGASLEPREAIISASLEAVRRHISSRDRYFREKPVPPSKKDTTDWSNFKKLQMWASPSMSKAIMPILSGPRKEFKLLKDYSKKNDRENSSFLIKQLLSKKYNIFCSDITPFEVKETGLVVIKVLVPELLPLYHDERYPYKGSWRLYNLPSLLKKGPIKKEDEIDYHHPF